MQRFIKSLFSLETLIKPSNGMIAAIGAFISPILNGMISSGKFWTFILFVAIVGADWIAGTAAAKRSDSYRSEY